jgi:hypothetical protein
VVAGEVDERVIWPVTCSLAAFTRSKGFTEMTDLSLGLRGFCHIDLMIIE